MEHQLVEKNYNDLFKFALGIATKYVGYDDRAYDITQNALLSLITAPDEIKNPHAWLRTVVKREVSKILNGEKKEMEIAKKRQSQAKIKPVEDEEADRIPDTDEKTVKMILSATDYRVYQKLKKVEFNIQKYADSSKMSYNTAAFHKQRIKRNLTSALLIKDGWLHSPKILSFPQFNNINRFIRTIIRSIEERKIPNLINYLRGVDKQRVEEIFQDIDSCAEWGICNEGQHFSLSLCCFSAKSPIPRVPIFSIIFDKKNYLKVIQIREASFVAEIEEPGISLEKHMKKGTLGIESIEQVMDLLSR